MESMAYAPLFKPKARKISRKNKDLREKLKVEA